MPNDQTSGHPLKLSGEHLVKRETAQRQVIAAALNAATNDAVINVNRPVVELHPPVAEFILHANEPFVIHRGVIVGKPVDTDRETLIPHISVALLSFNRPVTFLTPLLRSVAQIELLSGDVKLARETGAPLALGIGTPLVFPEPLTAKIRVTVASLGFAQLLVTGRTFMMSQFAPGDGPDSSNNEPVIDN